MEAPIEAMWVLYDETCGFCCSCARWLRAQDKLVPLTCLPRSGDVARKSFGSLPWEQDELVVVDSRGGVYRGSEAFVMALRLSVRVHAPSSWSRKIECASSQDACPKRQ